VYAGGYDGTATKVVSCMTPLRTSNKVNDVYGRHGIEEVKGIRRRVGEYDIPENHKLQEKINVTVIE
jgi:hypothetical protein